MAKTPSEIAIELRARFEFYLLALTFGILGLSIQTAKFGDHLVADAFELIGWLALFVAGVIGILRTQWVSVLYEIQAKKDTIDQQQTQVLTALAQGIQLQVTFEQGGRQTVLVGQAAADKHAELLAKLEGQTDDNEKRIRRRYRAMMWAFMFGIGFLLVARGIRPTLSIWGRLSG